MSVQITGGVNGGVNSGVDQKFSKMSDKTKQRIKFNIFGIICILFGLVPLYYLKNVATADDYICVAEYDKNGKFTGYNCPLSGILLIIFMTYNAFAIGYIYISIPYQKCNNPSDDIGNFSKEDIKKAREERGLYDILTVTILQIYLLIGDGLLESHGIISFILTFIISITLIWTFVMRIYLLRLAILIHFTYM